MRQKDDFYPTPKEAIDALIKVENLPKDIWEPACGNGAISKPLISAGHNVISTDLNDYGYGKTGVDFLMEFKPLILDQNKLTRLKHFVYPSLFQILCLQ